MSLEQPLQEVIRWLFKKEVPKNSQLLEGFPTTPLFLQNFCWFQGEMFVIVFPGKGQVKPHIFSRKNICLQVHHHLGLNELQPNPPNQNHPTSLYQRSSLTLVLFEDAATTQIHAVVNSTHGLLGACDLHQEDRLLARSAGPHRLGWLFCKKLGGATWGANKPFLLVPCFLLSRKRGYDIWLCRQIENLVENHFSWVPSWSF